MATRASRLAKIESQLSLCDDCKETQKREEIFRASLLSHGAKLVRETATNTRIERCETCGQAWRCCTGFDDDWSRAEVAALLEIGERNKEAKRKTSREEWERFFAYNAEMNARQRLRYGAEAFDKAYLQAGFADVWERMKAYAANAPTNAEREPTR